MKTSTFLRIASAGALFLAVGHTLGHPWTPATGAAATGVIDSMKGSRFVVLGADRSYWDFYYGFGVTISVWLLAQSILLWNLATLARSDSARLRPMIATLFLANLATVYLDWKFFFLPPLASSIFIAAFLALALASAKPGSSESP